MRNKFNSTVLICCGCLLLLSQGPSFAACDILRQAEEPLVLANGHYNISVQLGQVQRLMAVDTGAEDTLLSDRIVRELGFPVDSRHFTIMTGVATRGEKIFNVFVPVFGIGQILSHNRSTSVGNLGGLDGGQVQPAGLIGGDILSQYDVEMDFPAKKMTFYRVEGCAGRFVPWTESYATIPLMRKGTRALMAIDVDGHKLNALIDTGASGMMVKRQAALEAGVTADILAQDTASTASGVGGTPIDVRMHRFKKMVIGGQTFSNITVNVADVPLPVADMLLPTAYLKFRKVWISYSTNQLFIADLKKAD